MSLTTDHVTIPYCGGDGGNLGGSDRQAQPKGNMKTEGRRHTWKLCISTAFTDGVFHAETPISPAPKTDHAENADSRQTLWREGRTASGPGGAILVCTDVCQQPLVVSLSLGRSSSDRPGELTPHGRLWHFPACPLACSNR